MNIISGGLCAAKGFKAGSTLCGIKESQTKEDLAIILSDCPCTAAATYTLNQVKAAPLYVTMEHLKDGTARAIVVNSGNANACAPEGMENALRQAKAAADFLGIDENQVLVASTGVIGQRLNIECIEENIGNINLTYDGSEAASIAIMTTDTHPKTAAVEFMIGGKICRMGGIAKGSGMIHPNMGTMLSFITTDCAITQEMLQEALSESVKRSYNRVTVDGDTSTNDMCVVLANGTAENRIIAQKNEDYDAFYNALHEVNISLARQIAADGEGATKLITCIVRGAGSEEAAEALAKSVCGSSLVKAAIFGADANWGRVLCAMGYANASFNPASVRISFSSGAGNLMVCDQGHGVDFDEALAKKILLEKEITVEIDLWEGNSAAACWGCDLTYDYVKINGDYRT